MFTAGSPATHTLTEVTITCSCSREKTEVVLFLFPLKKCGGPKNKKHLIVKLLGFSYEMSFNREDTHKKVFSVYLSKVKKTAISYNNGITGTGWFLPICK